MSIISRQLINNYNKEQKFKFECHNDRVIILTIEENFLNLKDLDVFIDKCFGVFTSEDIEKLFTRLILSQNI